VLQGTGGGPLTPVGMALLNRTFPPQAHLPAQRRAHSAGVHRGLPRARTTRVVLNPESCTVLGSNDISALSSLDEPQSLQSCA
jgi:hypothetical protein